MTESSQTYLPSLNNVFHCHCQGLNRKPDRPLNYLTKYDGFYVLKKLTIEQ